MIIYFTQQRVVRRLLMLVVSLAAAAALHAQSDTIIYSLNNIDRRFLDSNLNLLAAHYNVDAGRALIQQAKLWQNPIISTDQNIYAGNRFFEHGKDMYGNPTGEYYVQLQQLIQTAGKRGKQIALATTNTKLSELQLQDVLRNLRYQLHQDYYTIAQLLATKELLTAQLARLNNLENAMQAQLQAGNIAQKDYLRIQALVIALQQDITENNKNIVAAEQDMKMLLQANDNVFIKPADVLQNNVTLPPDVNVLIDTAKAVNARYLLQLSQQTYAAQNLNYQKALRVPDVTVAPEFDRNSNYVPDYVGLGISLPLPLWNRNQGNIKSAEFGIKQQQTEVLAAATQLRSNITSAYQRLLLTYQQNNVTQKTFYSNYQKLFANMLQSYQQRQISLLELLDFIDSYQQAQMRLLQQQFNLQLAKEELNYEVGTDVIK
ncbi:TolC family protein [Ilyomonas limi]|uniref:TolC family protein n=1 Tax=Ilyomonas limi TaxID=2575867 RepID=A0A4U3KWC0_9BACT|nr:TolC family protein [Ilyomonas limi]TKK66710.1 TolC family protein [Ilyomonas limi]